MADFSALVRRRALVRTSPGVGAGRRVCRHRRLCDDAGEVVAAASCHANVEMFGAGGPVDDEDRLIDGGPWLRWTVTA